MKVLLIDDDDSTLSVYSIALKQAGIDIATASTSTDGINKARSEKPDIIVLDQILPDASGNETLKELKSQEETKNIPVLILSNFSQQELVRGAIDGGVVDYIFKYQVEPREVIDKI
ncbi:response regulator, partial [Patescibacteria group bacterium]|nr:response regulator [Patescibacteria group bacterium]